MKNRYSVLFCVFLLGAFDSGLMAILPQNSTFSTNLQRECNQWKEAVRCFKNKGWKNCTRSQKKRLAAAGVAIAVVTTVVVGGGTYGCYWKFVKNKEDKKGSEEESAKPEEKPAEESMEVKTEEDAQEGAVYVSESDEQKETTPEGDEEKDESDDQLVAEQEESTQEQDVPKEKKEVVVEANDKNATNSDSQYLCSDAEEFFTAIADVGARNNYNRFSIDSTERRDYTERNNLKVLYKEQLTNSTNLKKFAKSKDKNNNIALHMVLSNQYEIGASLSRDLVKNLIFYVADINAANDEGNTPLHVAAQDCHYRDDIFEELVKAGAYMNKPNSVGNTPLHLMCLTQNKSMLVAFKNAMQKCKSVDLNVKNNQGETPLDLVGSNPGGAWQINLNSYGFRHGWEMDKK